MMNRNFAANARSPARPTAIRRTIHCTTFCLYDPSPLYARPVLLTGVVPFTSLPFAHTPSIEPQHVLLPARTSPPPCQRGSISFFSPQGQRA
jgi:hypothetical protein